MSKPADSRRNPIRHAREERRGNSSKPQSSRVQSPVHQKQFQTGARTKLRGAEDSILNFRFQVDKSRKILRVQNRTESSGNLSDQLLRILLSKRLAKSAYNRRQRKKLEDGPYDDDLQRNFLASDPLEIDNFQTLHIHFGQKPGSTGRKASMSMSFEIARSSTIVRRDKLSIHLAPVSTYCSNPSLAGFTPAQACFDTNHSPEGLQTTWSGSQTPLLDRKNRVLQADQSLLLTSLPGRQ